jgi:hypothetical protein
MDNKTLGPKQVITLTCKGCEALETEWWKDYLDNDETDCGTSAFCIAAGKTITAYWSERNAPPSWCPYRKENLILNS